MRRDTDRVAHECHDTHKELQCTEGRNADLCHKIRDCENALGNMEACLCDVRRDVECLRQQNANSCRLNEDILGEREALARHAKVLEAQNADLSKELDGFVHTDELLRSQLDRRSRVHGI